MIVAHCVMFYAKSILNCFACLRVRIFVGKWNIYKAHFFPRWLVYSLCLETPFLCLKTSLNIKEIFPKSHYFFEILVKVFNFMLLPLMISIIFHTQGHSTQENDSYILDFYVSGDVLFSHLATWKSPFSHRSISLYELITKMFRVFGGQ